MRRNQELSGISCNLGYDNVYNTENICAHNIIIRSIAAVVVETISMINDLNNADKKTEF